MRYLPAAVILGCATVLWWAIGVNEIQPWDEGFYAVRALAVVEKGAWLDQTPYALGGLYTSTYPPLSIWATALSILVFGTNEFAVRFYAASCGTASLVLIYSIAGFSFNKRIAILAPMLLAGTVVWNHYARLGMLDIPLVMWMLLVLWSTLRACNSVGSRLLGWCCVVMLAIACGLMSKIVVSLIPLLFLVYAFKEKGNTKTTWMIVAAMCAGVVLALPWHIWMINEHGVAFYKAFMLPHITSTIEGSGRWLGPLFYINQLVVAHPFAILAFAWLIAHAKTTWSSRGERIVRRLNNLDIVLVMWFVLGLMIFSFAATKMMHYTVVLIPPLILLCLRGVEHFFSDTSTRISWFLGTAVIVAGVWSTSQTVRDAVQHSLTVSPTVLGMVCVVALLVLLLCAPFSPRAVRARYARHLAILVLWVVPVSMIVRNAYANGGSNANVLQGTRTVASWLDHSGVNHFYYTCEEFDPSDSLSPSLAWYTKGWTCGWRNGYSRTYDPLPIAWTGNDPLVCLIPPDTNAAELFNQSMIGRRLVLRTKCYLVYK